MFPNPSKLWLYLSCTLDRHVTEDLDSALDDLIAEEKDEPEIEDCPFCGAKAADLDKLKGLGVYVHFNAPSSDTKPWPHVS